MVQTVTYSQTYTIFWRVDTYYCPKHIYICHSGNDYKLSTRIKSSTVKFCMIQRNIDNTIFTYISSPIQLLLTNSVPRLTSPNIEKLLIDFDKSAKPYPGVPWIVLDKSLQTSSPSFMLLFSYDQIIFFSENSFHSEILTARLRYYMGGVIDWA